VTGHASSLADARKHVDDLVRRALRQVLEIVNALTAEDDHVAAIFDHDDREAMQIYEELGFRAASYGDRGATVMDIQQDALDDALRRRRYVPIDELPNYQAGTVLLYVLTRGVAVARRYEKAETAVMALREVVRTRDIEIRSGLRVESAAAIHIILQRCAPLLQRLWNGKNDRVALVQRASHGAKVGYLDRQFASDALRRAVPDVADLADRIARGPHDAMVDVVFRGWGTTQILSLEPSSMRARAVRNFDDEDEALLHAWIVACRDQKRALGLLEKTLDALGPSATASTLLADLIALIRYQWTACAEIAALIPKVRRAAVPLGATPAATRLHGVLVALGQATTERQRGGAINSNGGKT
jgi:hypothetical protein